jgi:trimeric autotransporter adhesin
MRKIILTFLAILFLALTNIYGQTITFQNPSFEGTPGTPHVSPPFWNNCQPGTTPDTQPGCWGVTLPPSNGNSYIGLCNQTSGNWHEGTTQTLISPLVAGTTYSFTVDLAITNSTDGGITPGCIEMQVFANMGGNSGCDESYLCWSSGNVANLTWQTYLVTFTATQNWTTILFMSHNLECSDSPYIIMDNLNGSSLIFPEDATTICADTAALFAGSGFAEYLWSTGDTTQSVNIFSSGMYYISATTYDGDTISDSIQVHLTHPYLNLNLGNDTLICSSASILLNAGGGFANYNWNTGSSGSAITVSQTGIYQVLTTDTALCTYTDSIEIVIDPLNSLELGNDTSLCDYSPFILDAGIGFDDFTWSTGESTQSIYIDSSGTYYVTATNTSCSVTVIDSLQVTFNALPIAEAGINDTICPGETGTLTASGGNSYHWSTGNTSQTISSAPITTTTYFVTVTNSAGCDAIDSASIVVLPAVVSNITHTDASCGLDNGSATVVPGGIGLFSYQWNTIPQQYTSTITNLSAGTYTVVITDDVTGCTSTNSVTISDIPIPFISSQSTVSANCGMSNGSITVTTSGGSAPYNYIWNSVPSQNTNILVNVPSGNYCVTVTDNDGCTSTACVTISSVGYTAPEICLVSVDTVTNHNIVIWEKPVTNGIDQYYIYRESSISGIYNLIGAQNYSDYSTYLDTTSNSIQQPYRYKLAIFDTCGTLSQQGTHHQTIHLTVYAGSGGSWNLLWNDYEGFTFSTYNIYRGTNSSNLSLLNSVASSVTSYTDVTPPAGNMYYLIEAVRPTPCNPAFKEDENVTSTVSNIANTSGIGFSEFSGDENIQIFPNPANSSLIISGDFQKNSEVIILNYTGQIIYRGLLSSPVKIIDVSGFSKSMYYLIINDNGNMISKKIVIE